MTVYDDNIPSLPLEWNGTGCPTQTDLTNYIRLELDTEGHIEVAKHIEKCPKCLADADRIESEIDQKIAEEDPEGFQIIQDATARLAPFAGMDLEQLEEAFEGEPDN